MEKIKVSQDILYNYLMEHSFIIANLSRLMGVSEAIVNHCFRHVNDRHGKPLKFTAQNVERLNVALEQVADEIRRCVLTFGSEQSFTNQRGATYDPALIDSIKNGVARYFKLKGLTERVLGWNKAKCDITLAVKSSPMYGHITREDMERINAELLSVAGVLSNYEVVINMDTQAQ